ncbi:uncharacterized protein LOC141851938 [Brevipalpus obovatus]|uniref:uncharacterized protein LOC141851938 n=1 Tax=Brevipalpus obovatus TaxID=246614 RepID=UPI003D9F872B
MSSFTLAFDDGDTDDVDIPLAVANLTLIHTNDVTNFLEVYHLSILYISSHFLLLSLITCFPVLNQDRFRRWRILIEICVLSMPFLASVTILNSLSFLIPYILVMIALRILFTFNRIYGSFNWPELLFRSKPVPIKSPTITNLYANTIINVCICILAVDFCIFPERFAKTKIYGLSLMDIGVSSFVALNGLLSKESRHHSDSLSPSFWSHFRKSIRGSILLFFLGFLRLGLITITGYHQEISEYGLHWNFFFTLAFTKIISSSIMYVTSSTLIMATLISFLGQSVLSLGLTRIIQNPHRQGFILANKEGIFSLPGFVSIYLIGVTIGKRFSEKRDRKSNMDSIFLIGDLFLMGIYLGSTGLLSHLYIEPSSRRECNLAFVAFTCSLICFTIIFELFVDVLIDILQYFMIMKKSPFVKSFLNEALARKGLVVFLFANLLTGIFNLAFRLKSFSSIVSLVLNVFYIFSVCIFALYSHKNYVNFKFSLKPLKVNIF